QQTKQAIDIEVIGVVDQITAHVREEAANEGWRDVPHGGVLAPAVVVGYSGGLLQKEAGGLALRLDGLASLCHEIPSRRARQGGWTLVGPVVASRRPDDQHTLLFKDLGKHGGLVFGLDAFALASNLALDFVDIPVIESARREDRPSLLVLLDAKNNIAA